MRSYDRELFSKALRQTMEMKNWKQKDLAAHFNVDQSNVSMWIRGKRIPDATHMTKFAELTGLNEQDLQLMRIAINAEIKGLDFSQMQSKGTILSDDEKLLVHFYRAGKFIEAIDFVVRRAKDIQPNH